jgi:hypothetical protein
LFRNGAVGFIDSLDLIVKPELECLRRIERNMKIEDKLFFAVLV